MENILIISAVICVLAIVGSKLTGKIGVSSLLIFLVLGMIFGVDGIFGISFDNYYVTEKISTIGLIFIMFYGGFGTNWKTAKPVIVPSTVLATLGVAFTALLTGILAAFILKCNLLEGLLLGAVVASTDAASVFAILRQKKLNLSGGLAPLLEIESGSNDPFAYMITTVLLGILSASVGEPVLLSVFKQVAFGLLFGVLIGKAATYIMQKINLLENQYHYLFMLAAMLLSYGLPQAVGGNGFLSVYITGILMGNSYLPGKVELVHFFDGVTEAMQLLLFFLLGLLATPSHIVPILLPAFLIAVGLSFIVRPIVVFTLLIPFKFSFKQKLFLSQAGLRGAASIVFAIYTVISQVATGNDLFHIVFCIACFSVGIQGTLLPWFAKKLSLIDDMEDVGKTFNDYQNDTDMNLIEIRISEESEWHGKTLAEISMPPGMLAVMVKRKKGTFIPNGDTKIEKGDIVIVSCVTYVDHSDVHLFEISVGRHHKWCGRQIRDLNLSCQQLVVMIKRQCKVLIPDGATPIEADDVLVICQNDA